MLFFKFFFILLSINSIIVFFIYECLYMEGVSELLSSLNVLFFLVIFLMFFKFLGLYIGVLVFLFSSEMLFVMSMVL